MLQKRRDSKNRILNTGESQKPNGLYVFKYVDAGHKSRFIYSWRLVEGDRLPAGKRPCRPLREREREILRDLEDGIDPFGRKMTVGQLYAKFTRYSMGVRDGTVRVRKQLERVLAEDGIGAWEIGRVRLTDAAVWAQRMKSKGYAYSTISNYKQSLKAAFRLAIADGCIRKNPFDFKLSTVIRREVVEREPLSRVQADALLGFMRADTIYRRYADEVVILLGTGMRISEMCGLTDADIDFDTRMVRIDHQLVRGSRGRYAVEEPKTASGRRSIYMTDEVMAAFEWVMSSRPKTEPVSVDGRTGFIFLNRNGMPKLAADYDRVFKGLRSKAEQAGLRLPEHMTPHTLRHTFCTEMAKAGMSPKVLQYIMGHKDIKMTLGYYTHIDGHAAADEMRRVLV